MLIYFKTTAAKLFAQMCECVKLGPNKYSCDKYSARV